MARKSNHKNSNTPRDVRERLLQEATRLFAQNGFEGTSIQAIADAVGIRKPSLLYHFSSKDELRTAVTQQLLGHWQAELPRLLSAATDEQDRFSSTITAVVEFFREDANRATLVLREVLDRPAEIRELIEGHLRPWTKLVADYIRLGQRLGVVRPGVDPEAYIIQVIMMVLGTVATGGVAQAIFPLERPESAAGPNALDAKIAELVRIARDALFVNPDAKQT